MPKQDAPTGILSDRSGEAAETRDLVEHLKRVLPRQVGDILRITPIPGTHSFRANWFDTRVVGTRSVPGLSIAYIRHSTFLHCRMGDDGTPQISYPARQ